MDPAPGCDQRIAAAACCLGRRGRWPVRLSRAVFPGATLRAAGRSRPVELSLAASDRAVFGAVAGRTPGAHHIIGAVLGLAGTVLLFAGNAGTGFAPGQVPGLIAAFVAAFVWAAYSGISRKFKSIPTDAVAGFCLATALLAAVVHGVIAVTVWPDTAAQWLAITALGVGPVGAAFYAWDIGMKRGDIRVLGAASYATPLLSTAFLILAGFAKPSVGIAIAAVLIAGGGLIAAKDMITRGDRAGEVAPGQGKHQLEHILDSITAWAVSRPDILGLALIGSQA